MATSLEGILNFSSHPLPLGTELRNRARHRFYDICQHFDKGIPLIRYTYEHSLSEESGNYFLRYFFKAIDLSIDGNNPICFNDMRAKFFNFAKYLFNNFFLLSKVLLLSQLCIPQFKMYKVTAGNNILELNSD
ncbi:hypothetical protein RRF57_006035 [Xylaria bambusicola]|uniref:Uncharacterized protein n=1 Tax=Xylaria bambusicola TaxID=326684 RepID=A0AAN7YY93_9PEZI